MSHGATYDLFANRVAFRVIGVEEPVYGDPLQGQAKLPAQVVGVLDAGVHALSSRRRVDMGGISGQEDPAVAVAVDDPVADAEE